ncbi:MAG: hypothetical protein EB072_01900 [Betaproteobacteria bacterium]|nr:hypothetical protein [Betaproteobacteria bacterium]
MENTKSSFQPFDGIPTLEGVLLFGGDVDGQDRVPNGRLKHGLFDVSTKSQPIANRFGERCGF